MRSTLLHFQAQDVPFLAQGTCLAVNIEERIVTLVGAQVVVLAQGQLSSSALRLLVLLLKVPNGCLYPELFACLHCPDAVFRRVLTASGEQAVRILDPYTTRWRERLAEIAVGQGPKGYEQELKRVRRIVKESSTRNNNIHFMFQSQEFGLAVRVMSKKGYVIRRSTMIDEPSRKKVAKVGV